GPSITDDEGRRHPQDRGVCRGLLGVSAVLIANPTRVILRPIADNNGRKCPTDTNPVVIDSSLYPQVFIPVGRAITPISDADAGGWPCAASLWGPIHCATFLPSGDFGLRCLVCIMRAADRSRVVPGRKHRVTFQP